MIMPFNLIGVSLDFVSLISALYISSSAISSKIFTLKERLKKSVYVSLVVLVVINLCKIAIPSPLFLGIIFVFVFGYAVNHFYSCGEWVVIFALALILTFTFMLATSAGLAVLESILKGE